MAHLLSTDGMVTEINPVNGSDFRIDELRKALDVRVVQIVHIKNGMVLAIDDEGKYNGSKPNAFASLLVGGNSTIYGNAVYCKSSQVYDARN